MRSPLADQLQGGALTLDEVLNSLFPQGHSIARHGGLLTGHAELAGTRVDVIGVLTVCRSASTRR